MTLRKSLNISGTLKLPLETVTQTTVMLAIKGAGKTNTAVVLAEELSRNGQQVVVIDPTGVWYGIRSSADGKSAGLPFVIFGGEHGDVALEPGAGETIATSIVEGDFSAVIDLSGLRKSQFLQFMQAFLETLYRVKSRNKTAMLLVVDEADTVAPQKPFGNEAGTLGAMQDVVRRGRSRGIGVVMISQRPQVLNKDVLDQADLLVALRISHPKAMNAVKEWVDVHADPETAKQMYADLPSMPTGMAWFWSPSADLFVKTQVRKRETFDSSYTPKPGERRREPKNLAQIDLAALGAQIGRTIEQQKANDPKELKARIAMLERELAKKPTPSPAAPAAPREITQREKDAITRPLYEERRKIGLRVEKFDSKLDAAIHSLQQLTIDITQIREMVQFNLPADIPTQLPAYKLAPAAQPKAPRPTSAPREGSGEGKRPSKAARAILTVLAQFGSTNRNKIAAIAGYSVTSGSFRNAISENRTQGYLDGSDPLTLTPDGAVALGSYEPLPTGPALLEQWNGKLTKAAREILNVILAAPQSREAIGEATGYSVTSGSFRNALSELRTLELIQRGDPITLHPDFAEAIQ